MPRVYESWLRSEDNEKWASAMCTCESGAPWYCSDNGECMLGGCFKPDVPLPRRLRRAATNESEDTAALLRLAADEIEYLHRPF